MKLESMSFVTYLWTLIPTQDGPLLWRITDRRNDEGKEDGKNVKIVLLRGRFVSFDTFVIKSCHVKLRT